MCWRGMRDITWWDYILAMVLGLAIILYAGKEKNYVLDYKGFGNMFCQAVSMKPNKLKHYTILPEKRFDILTVVVYNCEDGRVIY